MKTFSRKIDFSSIEPEKVLTLSGGIIPYIQYWGLHDTGKHHRETALPLFHSRRVRGGDAKCD